MTVLLDIFGMTIYRAINAPGSVKNIIYGINNTGKCYLKEKM